MDVTAKIQTLKTLRGKFLLVVLPPVVICFLVFSIIFTFFSYMDKKRQAVSNLNRYAEIQTIILAKALWDLNLDGARVQMDSMLLIPEIDGAEVLEFTTGTAIRSGLLPEKDSGKAYFELQKKIVFKAPNGERHIGRLTIVSRKDRVYMPLVHSFLRDAFLLLLLIAAIVASAISANRMIIDMPLQRFLSAIRRADRDNVRNPVDWHARDELGEVIAAYNKLLENLGVAEKELRIREERYRSVFEATGSATVIVEDDTTISLANSTFERLSGYSREEIENRMRWTDFVHPDDLERMTTYHNERRGGDSIVPDAYEFRFIDREGTIRHIYNQIGLIPKTRKKIAALIDITSRKLAEEALHDEKEKFRVLVEKAPVGVSLIGKDGGYIYINPKFIEIFGYTLADIPTGRDWFQKAYPEPEYRREVKASWFRGLKMSREGDDRPHINKVTCKDGSEKIISFKPVTMDTGSQFVIYENITDTKRLESQLQHAQKMKAIGTLAGGIAHDFNNLLMGIQGRTSMMLMDSHFPRRFAEHLEGIEHCVRSATDLTKQLLGFAREGKYEVKPTDLNNLLKEQSSLFGRTRKEIHIEESYAADLWTVEIDRGQIEQVLLNLFVNAWHAMAGGGTLRIRTENVIIDEQSGLRFSTDPGRYVKISVADSGMGMDEATRKKIFDPFFTTKKRERGTGLGLASVYGIVENHGGFIDVFSRKGEGSTFTIFLPSSEKKPDRGNERQRRPLRGNETVLLVDDEEIIVDVGRQILKTLGYRVLPVMSGKEALALYKRRRNEIDIVILDMIMPDMGGGDVYDRLKAVDRGVKILLSSGYSLDGQAAEILGRGCDGFIQKPFNVTDLSHKIREILGPSPSP